MVCVFVGCFLLMVWCGENRSIPRCRRLRSCSTMELSQEQWLKWWFNLQTNQGNFRFVFPPKPFIYIYIYIYVNYITTLKFLRVTCGEHTCYLFWEQKTLEVEYPVWPATTPNLRVLNKYIIYHHLRSRWWFKYVFFTPTWGNDPIWLTSFRWVETTT